MVIWCLFFLIATRIQALSLMAHCRKTRRADLPIREFVVKSFGYGTVSYALDDFKFAI
jgi:hypothetical protein